MLINIFFGILLLVVIYLLFRIIKSKKVQVLPTISNKSLFGSFLIKNKKLLLITFFILTVLILGSGGTVLALSLKTKSQGDTEYKNANYTQALTTYLKAEDLWFPDKVSIRLRDRDLYAKIANTRLMVQSGDNFQKGKEAFDKGQYLEAKKYLFKVATNDPNKPSAQEMITFIAEITNKSASLSGTKPKPTNIPLSKTQNQTQTPTPFTPITFPAIPTPAPPTYNDLHCPKITKIQDSLGNVANSADGKSVLNATINSDVKQLSITIYATDPQNLPLYYKFGISEFGNSYDNLTDNNWIKDNTKTVTMLPIGSSIYFEYRVDNQDGYNCSPSTPGGDEGGAFIYRVIRAQQ